VRRTWIMLGLLTASALVVPTPTPALTPEASIARAATTAFTSMQQPAVVSVAIPAPMVNMVSLSPEAMATTIGGNWFSDFIDGFWDGVIAAAYAIYWIITHI
jgi:hypothetical protein